MYILKDMHCATRFMTPCRTEKVDFSKKFKTKKKQKHNHQKNKSTGRITRRNKKKTRKKQKKQNCGKRRFLFFFVFFLFFRWFWFSSLFFLFALFFLFFCQTLYSLCCWTHKHMIGQCNFQRNQRIGTGFVQRVGTADIKRGRIMKNTAKMGKPAKQPVGSCLRKVTVQNCCCLFIT